MQWVLYCVLKLGRALRENPKALSRTYGED